MKTNIRAQHHSAWRVALDSDLNEIHGIPAVVRSRGPLADWSILRGSPRSRIETELLFAVQIAAASYDHPLVDTCLRRAVEVFEEGEKDARWHSTWAHSRTVAHGAFASTGSLALAWLRDGTPNMIAITAAGSELLEGSIQDRPSWTEMAQCEYLHGVQLYLISGQPSLAAEQLRLKRPWSCTKPYYEWQKEFVDLVRDQKTEPSLIASQFDGFFDLIRNPSPGDGETAATHAVLDIGLLRLRLALIRWIYIERQPIAGNWRHIIGQIGY